MARKNDFISKIDKYVGCKIYALRLARGLSRDHLALAIGVSHQQLQKYEKGNNRVSIGRLMLIAKSLAKNVSYFYEGFDSSNASNSIITQHQRLCLEISRNFMKIDNLNHQAAVHNLVKFLSKAA